MIEVNEIPASLMLEMSPDMRDEFIEALHERLEDLQVQAKIIARAISLTEGDIRRLEGVPSTEDYTAAYERVKAGEDPRAVRADFQKHFDVTNQAFRAAMARRRRWEEEAQ